MRKGDLCHVVLPAALQTVDCGIPRYPYFRKKPARIAYKKLLDTAFIYVKRTDDRRYLCTLLDGTGNFIFSKVA